MLYYVSKKLPLMVVQKTPGRAQPPSSSSPPTIASHSSSHPLHALPFLHSYLRFLETLTYGTAKMAGRAHPLYELIASRLTSDHRFSPLLTPSDLGNISALLYYVSKKQPLIGVQKILPPPYTATWRQFSLASFSPAPCKPTILIKDLPSVTHVTSHTQHTSLPSNFRRPHPS